VLAIGKRTINTLRVFNFRHGLDPALEAPSPRYGSTPSDGPAEGKDIAPYFQWMKSFYFELMGWEPATGKPLPHTLHSLGLGAACYRFAEIGRKENALDDLFD